MGSAQSSIVSGICGAVSGMSGASTVVTGDFGGAFGDIGDLLSGKPTTALPDPVATADATKSSCTSAMNIIVPIIITIFVLIIVSVIMGVLAKFFKPFYMILKCAYKAKKEKKQQQQLQNTLATTMMMMQQPGMSNMINPMGMANMAGGGGGGVVVGNQKKKKEIVRDSVGVITEVDGIESFDYDEFSKFMEDGLRDYERQLIESNGFSFDEFEEEVYKKER